MSLWIGTIQLGVKSLWLHPLRSLLTVLGIFIGVASVIWLLAISKGIGGRGSKANRESWCRYDHDSYDQAAEPKNGGDWPDAVRTHT